VKAVLAERERQKGVSPRILTFSKYSSLNQRNHQPPCGGLTPYCFFKLIKSKTIQQMIVINRGTAHMKDADQFFSLRADMNNAQNNRKKTSPIIRTLITKTMLLI